jgi:hypothetical protein
VPRFFRFVDFLGCEIHTINDPEDRLPIPEIKQVISIGTSRMLVESVRPKENDAGGPRTYDLRVRLIPTANEQVWKN